MCEDVQSEGKRGEQKQCALLRGANDDTVRLRVERAVHTQAGWKAGKRGGARSAAELLQDVSLRNAANRSEVKASAGTQRHRTTLPPKNSPWMHVSSRYAGSINGTVYTKKIFIKLQRSKTSENKVHVIEIYLIKG